MSHPIRCRRCAARFAPVGCAAVLRTRRRCPCYPSSLPLTGGVPAIGGGRLVVCPLEAT